MGENNKSEVAIADDPRRLGHYDGGPGLQATLYEVWGCHVFVGSSQRCGMSGPNDKVRLMSSTNRFMGSEQVNYEFLLSSKWPS